MGTEEKMSLTSIEEQNTTNTVDVVEDTYESESSYIEEYLGITDPPLTPSHLPGTHAYIYSYIRILIHTYTHTYICSYIHIIKHTYAHTYI